MKTLAFALSLLASLNASASQVQINFSGVLDLFANSVGSSVLNGRTDGDTVSGSVIFDLDLAPSASNGNYAFSQIGLANADFVQFQFDDFSFIDAPTDVPSSRALDQVAIDDSFGITFDSDRILFRDDIQAPTCFSTTRFCSIFSLELFLEPDTLSGISINQAFNLSDSDLFGARVSTLDFRYFDNTGSDLILANGEIVLNSISVAPIPLPAAAWLFLSGLVAMFGISRARKR